MPLNTMLRKKCWSTCLCRPVSQKLYAALYIVVVPFAKTPYQIGARMRLAFSQAKTKEDTATPIDVLLVKNPLTKT